MTITDIGYVPSMIGKLHNTLWYHCRHSKLCSRVVTIFNFSGEIFKPKKGSQVRTFAALPPVNHYLPDVKIYYVAYHYQGHHHVGMLHQSSLPYQKR